MIGADPDKLRQQFAETGREAVVSESCADLAGKRRQEGAGAHFEIAVWFYPSEKRDDNHVAEDLSHRADEIVLIPSAGADVAQRRPQLVESFRRFGLLPDYECDLRELHPEAVRLRRGPSGSVDELIPAVETAFTRLNTRLSALQRIFQIRVSELEAADRKSVV